MGDEGERAFERSRPLNRSLTQRDAFVSFSSSLTERERERESKVPPRETDSVIASRSVENFSP